MIFIPDSKHAKPVAVVVLFAIVIGLVVIFAKPPVSEAPAKETPDGLPQEVSITGDITCLPHKDTSGPQTLECAFGLKATSTDADGFEYYSLDLSAAQFEAGKSLDSAKRAIVNGTFVPVEALSSDHWQKYDMKGIIRVSSFEKLK